MFKIGCHLSERNGFMAMAEETTGLGGNTFQFFTRNPRGGAVKQWDQEDLDAFKKYAAEHDFAKIVGYAPYTANPASSTTEELDFARMVFSQDISRMDQIPGQFYAAHPGSAVGSTQEEGIANCAEVLNETLQDSQTTTFLVITTSGRGTEIASSFQDLTKLLDSIKMQEHVGVLFDLCNVWGAGYDVKDNLDGVLDEFDKAIGVDRIKAVHIADPKYGLGTHHDHHDPLGEGMLGQSTFDAAINNPRLADKVFILETPHDMIDYYQKEMQLLKAARKIS